MPKKFDLPIFKIYFVDISSSLTSSFLFIFFLSSKNSFFFYVVFLFDESPCCYFLHAVSYLSEGSLVPKLLALSASF